MKPMQHCWDIVFESASEIFDGHKTHSGLGVVIGVQNGTVVHLGAVQPDRIGPQTDRIDCSGMIITPGLIDCHTHLVFGGDRSEEFSLRAAGGSYEEILAAGGGIHNTVGATRMTSFADLSKSARRRLDTMLSFGVTTVEVKSGYGLDIENELKILNVIQSLSDHPIDCISTCLAAHIVPKEYTGQKSAYLSLIIDELLPEVARLNLCEFVDVFIESNAFSNQDAARLFDAAIGHGLGLKMHSEQLTHQGSAELAGQYGAVSADHLEFISECGIKALQEGGTTAVLLPSCNLFLQQETIAPARRLLDAHCKVAISTDCNPGSSMVENLLLCMSLGMTQMGMTGTEVWRGVTQHAASAVNRNDRGMIQQGCLADLALFKCASVLEVPYRMGSMRAYQVFKRGECVFTNSDQVNSAIHAK